MVNGQNAANNDNPAEKELKRIFAPAIEAMRERLGDELYAVLIHGSAVRNLQNADDYDPIFVLRSPGVAKVRALRESLAEVNWDRHVEVQIVCASQLPSQSDYFSLKANGPLLLRRLKDALTLYGDNPYRHIAEPSSDAFKRSLMAEVQRNLWFARHGAGQGAENLTDAEIYQVTKKTWWSIKNLLMWVEKDHPDFEDDFKEICVSFPDMLDDRSERWLAEGLAKRGRERELFLHLDAPARTAFLDDCLGVHEAVYGEILKLAADEFELTFFV